MFLGFLPSIFQHSQHLYLTHDFTVKLLNSLYNSSFLPSFLSFPFPFPLVPRESINVAHAVRLYEASKYSTQTYSVLDYYSRV